MIEQSLPYDESIIRLYKKKDILSEAQKNFSSLQTQVNFINFNFIVFSLAGRYGICMVYFFSLSVGPLSLSPAVCS